MDRPSNVTIESRKGCCTAAFEILEGAFVGDREVDAEREESEDESEDGEENVDTEREIISESNVVETELGCAVSTEDGTGIEDVNPGTGDWNEPLIRSSLNQRLSKSTPKTSKSTRTRSWQKML
jgi:hypothetical protein